MVPGFCCGFFHFARLFFCFVSQLLGDSGGIKLLVVYAVTLTGHAFQLVHRGEDGRVTVLEKEDDEQRQSVVIEQGSSPTGVT